MTRKIVKRSTFFAAAHTFPWHWTAYIVEKSQFASNLPPDTVNNSKSFFYVESPNLSRLHVPRVVRHDDTPACVLGKLTLDGSEISPFKVEISFVK